MLGGEPLLEAAVLTPGELAGRFGTSTRGLTAAEALARLQRIGPNELEQVRGPSLLRRVAAQFLHLFALLLWAGAVLAFLAGTPTLGVTIVAVIVLNGAFGFFQEYRAERAVAALRRLLPPRTTVLRDGAERRVEAATVVPGDVLVLAEGDRIPADGRLIEAADLRVDESSLTGEAHPVHKVADSEPSPVASALHAQNLVFAGSTILAGTARAIVLTTGMATEFGRIARLTQSVPQEPSPLQIEVDRVARRVALLSVGMGVAFFALGSAVAGLTLANGLVFAIGIVLGNVPEGLLPTMTLALAMAVQRMARRQAIVKRLSSVETLGSCSVICTDKTGTITRNEMAVREVWAGGRSATLVGEGYAPEGGVVVDGRPATPAERADLLPALRIGHLCNTARLLGPDGNDGSWGGVGDPTELALLVAAARAGLDRASDLEAHPIVRTFAFEPKRKRMSTIHRTALEGRAVLIACVKGAPDELLSRSVRILDGATEVPLSEARREQARRENDRMARAGLRVLAMGYRYLPAEDEPKMAGLVPGQIEEELVFAGLVGMQDPPREEVAAAVATCQAAGIRIVLITGDYGLTGESIARQVGILADGPARVVSGDELERMSDEALQAAVAERQILFARAAPEHKLRVVEALQHHGEIVAVTGDGVNDAPALRRADIGVAMGRSGTDVAREAADMVLTDDNFATIVAAVEEGRAVFDNMRKFIVYIFAHLSPEAVPYIVFALFGTPLPLTVMQILAIDLGTETLPALALGIERPESDVMRRPPRSRRERLLDTRSLLRGYVFLGGMTTAVVLSGFFLLLALNGWRWGHPDAPTPRVGAEATTIVFLGIVLMQVANAFACRTVRISALRVGLLSNRLLLAGIAVELVFAMAVIYLPGIETVFGTAAIDGRWWAYLTAFVPVIFLAEEGRKALFRRAGWAS